MIYVLQSCDFNLMFISCLIGNLLTVLIIIVLFRSIFLYFSCLSETCGYVYYESSIKVPKGISHQNIYYNYSVMPGGVTQMTYYEYFYDSRRDVPLARCLKIPPKSGRFLKEQLVLIYNVIGSNQNCNLKLHISADFISICL